MFRGELEAAREVAESFLREAERAGRLTEAAVWMVAAHRVSALKLHSADCGKCTIAESALPKVANY